MEPVEGSVDSCEELLAADGVRLHGLLAGSPVGGANLIGMGLHVLEGLQHAQGFIHVAAHGQVVDGGVHDHTIGIDDEQATQSDASVLVEHVVSRSDLFLEVGNEGVSDVAQAALVAGGLDPGEVAELAVHRNAEHFGVLAGEICIAVAECSDLRGAHEGEVERVEEQHHVLAAVLRQGDLFEFLVNHCSGGEIGGLLTHAQSAGGGHDGRAMVQPWQRPDFLREVESTTSCFCQFITVFPCVGEVDVPRDQLTQA